MNPSPESERSLSRDPKSPLPIPQSAFRWTAWPTHFKTVFQEYGEDGRRFGIDYTQYGQAHHCGVDIKSGSFGEIYLCVRLFSSCLGKFCKTVFKSVSCFGCCCQRNNQTGEELACKIECNKGKHPQLFYEAKLLKHLQGGSGIANLHFCDVECGFNVMVIDIFGK